MYARIPTSTDAIEPAAALAGWSVICLRERSQQAAAGRAIRAVGAQPLALPTLKLSPLPAAPQLRAALASAPAFVFCVSPAALRFALRLCPELPRRVVCGAGVGATSARALQRAGFRRVLTPAAGAGQTSEGLLAHPELAEGGGRGVLLIAAPGGREVLEQQLRARGFRVRRMEVYTRSAPRLDRRHFQLLEQAQPPLGLLLSSAQALDNLLAALPAALHERLKGAIVAAASPRLAEHAHACGFANVRTGSGPSTQALLETLAQMD